jgi:hypothetical protein
MASSRISLSELSRHRPHYPSAPGPEVAHPTSDLLTHRADAELVPAFKPQQDAVGIFLVGYLAEAELRHSASLADGGVGVIRADQHRCDQRWFGGFPNLVLPSDGLAVPVLKIDLPSNEGESMRHGLKPHHPQ